MARRVVRKSKEEKMMQEGWVRLLLAAAFLILSYGFASLAIDSGSLLEYGLALLFLGWAITQIFRAIRHSVTS